MFYIIYIYQEKGDGALPLLFIEENRSTPTTPSKREREEEEKSIQENGAEYNFFFRRLEAKKRGGRSWVIRIKEVGRRR